jgi:hypothetical protein
MKSQNTLNVITYLVMIIGLVFKFSHWPGANMMLIAAFVILIVSAVRYTLAGAKDSGMSSMVHYLMSIALLVFVSAGLFKVMHWPGGDVLQLTAYVLAVIIPPVLMFQKGSFHIPSGYFIMFAIFFTFFLFIIPKNPFSNALGFEPKDHASEATRQAMEQAEAEPTSTTASDTAAATTEAPAATSE